MPVMEDGGAGRPSVAGTAAQHSDALVRRLWRRHRDWRDHSRARLRFRRHPPSSVCRHARRLRRDRGAAPAADAPLPRTGGHAVWRVLRRSGSAVVLRGLAAGTRSSPRTRCLDGRALPRARGHDRRPARGGRDRGDRRSPRTSRHIQSMVQRDRRRVRGRSADRPRPVRREPARGIARRTFEGAADVCEAEQDLRERAQQELTRAHATLLQTQKLDAVGRLAGGVAHDFNNTLQVVLGWTELLRDETDPQQMREGIEHIHAAAERSRGLTRQLLTFSRPEMRAPKRVELHKFLPALVESYRRLLPNDISFVAQPAEGSRSSWMRGISARSCSTSC